MKTIQINGHDILCSHEVLSDEKTHHVSIRVDLSHEQSGKKISHVMTIGAEAEALPASYGKEQLAADVAAFKQRHAELFESKIRAAELASALEE
jgi:hypothetical protein